MSDQQVTEDEIPCITDAANLVVKLLHEQGMFLLDIREAVRALKPADGHDPRDPTYSELQFQSAIRMSEIERLQAKVADQALTIATLKDTIARNTASHRDDLDRTARIYSEQVDKRDAELAQTKHLLSEERALTAATVGTEVVTLRQENAAIRKSIGDGDYGPTAAELQRFRAREVELECFWRDLQFLIERHPDTREVPWNMLPARIAAVRDFKVTE